MQCLLQGADKESQKASAQRVPTLRRVPAKHFFLNPIQFLKLIYLFTFGCAGSSLLCGLSLVVESEGYSLVAVRGLLIAVASLVAEHSSGVRSGLSSWGSRALEHRLSSCGMQT